MRRSSAFAHRHLFLSLSLLLVVPSPPASAEDFVDDARIKEAFERGLGRLHKAGGLPTGASILRRLREAETKPALRADLGLASEDGLTDGADGADGADGPQGEAEAFARARAASLVFGHLYLCGKCDRLHANLAGAVAISPDGLVLTNHHVVAMKEAIVFGAMTSEGRILPVAELLAASERDDLALLRLKGATDLAHVAISTKVSTGDPLFVISHPDGHFFTMTRGHLARKYLSAKSKAPQLQLSADFARGSSGSGVFDLRGRLVGIATSTTSIYYRETDGIKENLQMVVKSAAPAESVLSLLGASQSAEPR